MMQRCPKFDTCSAPICPLDDLLQRRVHQDRDRTCVWLVEVVKPGGEDRINAALPSALADQLIRALPEVEAASAYVRRNLRKAARTGTRLANGKRLVRQGAR